MPYLEPELQISPSFGNMQTFLKYFLISTQPFYLGSVLVPWIIFYALKKIYLQATSMVSIWQ